MGGIVFNTLRDTNQFTTNRYLISNSFRNTILIVRRQESIYEMTGLYSETGDDSSVDVPLESEVSDSVNLAEATATAHLADTVIKCHSRQPSSGLVDRDKSITRSDDLSRDCGMFGCRPSAIQRFARIKVSCPKSLETVV